MEVLPTVPDKHYFSIGEVASLCKVKAHVLRYWESEFHQLKPLKRRGNRRYYKTREVFLIRKIKALLYDEGYTINGAKVRLSNELLVPKKLQYLSNELPSNDAVKVSSESYLGSDSHSEKKIKSELLEILDILQGSLDS